MKAPFRIMVLTILLAGLLIGCSLLQKQEDDGQQDLSEPPRVEDTDGDGVVDGTDRCSGSPVGAPVNSFGCWIPDPIYFDKAAWKVEANTAPKLDKIADVLVQNPGVSMFLYGHSDNIGSQKGNLVLSRRRADAVEAYLIDRGVAKDQLTKKWFGSDLPKATNKTAEGRMENRRVELILK